MTTDTQEIPVIVNKWLFRTMLILVVLLILQVALAYYNDYASCQRQVPVRNALRKLSAVEQGAVQNATDATSKRLRQAAANALNVAQVSCSKFPPEVK